jgi:AcrR family transcriptional regulator
MTRRGTVAANQGGNRVAKSTEQPSLRTRQRLRVEQDLQSAAFRLFTEHGFDAVPVVTIAAEAGVSERTFFRYFPTKEEVALTALERFGEDIMSSLEAAPLDRPWFEVLRGVYTTAVVVPVTKQGERPEEIFPSIDAVYRFALSSPRLRSSIDERARGWVSDIATIIARRLEVDVLRDPRPSVWASAVIFSALTDSMRRAALGESTQLTAGNSFDALRELFGGQ